MPQARFVCFEGPGRLRLSEMPLPQPGPGQLLVEVELCTLCKSDVLTHQGKRTEPSPSILGHEVLGRVAALPEGGRDDARGEVLEIGDRVLWSVFDSPADSSWSKKGLRQKDPGTKKYGHLIHQSPNWLSGGLASHMLLQPNTVIIRTESDLPASALAPLNCSLATMCGAFRVGGGVRGKSICVIGAGMLGLQGLAYAHSQGAAQLAAVDVKPNNLNRARQFGADEVFLGHEDVPKGEFDLVMETSGSMEAMKNSLDWLRIGGTAVWVGAVFPQGNLGIDPEQIVRKVLSIKGLHNYNEQDFLAAVKHMEQHGEEYPYADLVAQTYPLEEVEAAFQAAASGQFIRVGVKP